MTCCDMITLTICSYGFDTLYRDYQYQVGIGVYGWVGTIRPGGRNLLLAQGGGQKVPRWDIEQPTNTITGDRSK